MYSLKMKYSLTDTKQDEEIKGITRTKHKACSEIQTSFVGADNL